MSAAAIARMMLGENIWGEDFSPPPVPGLADLKRRVASIAAYAGRPVLRLDWWPDVYVTRAGVKQRAHVMFYQTVTTSEVVAIPIPRWGIRQLIPDEVCKAEWEQQQKDFTALHGFDWLGDFPPGGIYKEHPEHGTLARHEPEGKCCYRALVEEQRTCYGLYTPPTRVLVDKIAKEWRQFMAGPQRRRGADPGTPHEIVSNARGLAQGQKDARDRVWARIRDNLSQEMTSGRAPQFDMGAAHEKQEGTL